MWYKPVGEIVPAKCPYHLQDTIKRKKSVSPRTRSKRTKAGSKNPRKFLTPLSLKKHKINEHLNQQSAKRKLKKLKKYDVDVEGMTSSEILEIVSV